MGVRGFSYTAFMNRPNQHKSTANVVFEFQDKDGLVPVFPAGVTTGRDGRGPYALSNPDAVIAASTSTVDIAIDREHAMDVLPAGTSVPAAGWIKELHNIEGAIWAKVEWTEAAKAQLDSKEFRYLSPTFMHSKTKPHEISRIIGLSLVNRPNFEMKAVASEDDDNLLNQPTTEKETLEMNKLLLALASVMALASTATEDEILTTAAAKVGELNVLQKDFASVKTALKADDKADNAAVIATASQLVTAKSTASIDYTKYVPIEMYEAAANKLAATEKSTASEKSTAAVEKAIADGKIPPAQKDWAMSMASQDLEKFNSFVGGMPVIVSDKSEIKTEAAKKDGQLDDEEKAICKQLGLTEEQYKASKA